MKLKAALSLLLIMLQLSHSSYTSARSIAPRYTNVPTVEPDLYPWIGNLKNAFFNTTGCTAVQINPYWMLTAAHCLAGNSFFPPTDCLAVDFPNKSNGSEVSAEGFKILSGYDENNTPFYKDDLAIVKLSSPVYQTTYPVLNDAPLTSGELRNNGIYAKAGGYGHDGVNLYVADVLLDNQDSSADDLPPGAFQISYDGTIEDGDSGSGLFQVREGKPPLLLGICTHNYDNAAVCQRISRYIDFITEHTGLKGEQSIEQSTGLNITNNQDHSLYTSPVTSLNQTELCLESDCFEHPGCKSRDMIIGASVASMFIFILIVVSIITIPLIKRTDCYDRYDDWLDDLWDKCCCAY